MAAPDRAGWYLDPKRPGMRRYWDGAAWVDVDQVVDERTDPPAQRVVPPAPRLFAQRRPDGETDVVEPQPTTGEPESLQD